MIEINRLSTYPKSILDIPVELYQSAKEDQEKFDSYTISGEHYFRPDPPQESKQRLFQVLYDLLIRENILAFHATRLINADDIKLNGLHILRLDEYKERLKKQLLPLISTAQYNAIIGNLESYINSDFHSFRFGEICCFFNRSDCLLPDGYQNFSEYYGGEILENANYNNPEIVNTLSSVGKPYLISFNIAISDISKNTGAFRLEDLVNDFMASEMKRRINYWIHPAAFYSTLHFDIPADNIINITEIK